MNRRPICHMCRRTINPSDQWRVNDAGYQVHVKGFCRGPYASFEYVVGYRGDVPRFVGRLPEQQKDIEALTDELVGKGLEVRVAKMRRKSLNRLLEEMGL